MVPSETSAVRGWAMVAARTPSGVARHMPASAWRISPLPGSQPRWRYTQVAAADIDELDLLLVGEGGHARELAGSAAAPRPDELGQERFDGHARSVAAPYPSSVPHESGARGVSGRVSLPPFQRLVDDHATELHRFLVGCVGADAAEDCLQETFMAALRAYPRLRHGDNLRAWLYTIAQRKATDAIRLQTRRPARWPWMTWVPARARTDAATLPDESLWIAVRELPAKQREAVVHRYVLDLDYRQIAERMGTSEEAARQNVSAGLRRLRVEVTDR